MELFYHLSAEKEPGEMEMNLEKFRESVACHLPVGSRFYLVAAGSLSNFFFFLLNIVRQCLPNLHPLAFCSPFPRIMSCL